MTSPTSTNANRDVRVLLVIVQTARGLTTLARDVSRTLTVTLTMDRAVVTTAARTPGGTGNNSAITAEMITSQLTVSLTTELNATRVASWDTSPTSAVSGVRGSAREN